MRCRREKKLKVIKIENETYRDVRGLVGNYLKRKTGQKNMVGIYINK